MEEIGGQPTPPMAGRPVDFAPINGAPRVISSPAPQLGKHPFPATEPLPLQILAHFVESLLSE